MLLFPDLCMGYGWVFRWLLGCNPSEHGVARVSPEGEEFNLLYFHIWIPVHLPDSVVVEKMLVLALVLALPLSTFGHDINDIPSKLWV